MVMSNDFFQAYVEKSIRLLWKRIHALEEALEENTSIVSTILFDVEAKTEWEHINDLGHVGFDGESG